MSEGLVYFEVLSYTYNLETLVLFNKKRETEASPLKTKHKCFIYATITASSPLPSATVLNTVFNSASVEALMNGDGMVSLDTKFKE